MTGGAGTDIFAYTWSTIKNETGITATTCDTISGFTSATDQLKTGLAGTNGANANFETNTTAVADFAAALTAANGKFAASADLVYYQAVVGGDSYLFICSTGGAGTAADAVIKLVGVTSAIAFDDIVA